MLYSGNAANKNKQTKYVFELVAYFVTKNYKFNVNDAIVISFEFSNSGKFT